MEEGSLPPRLPFSRSTMRSRVKLAHQCSEIIRVTVPQPVRDEPWLPIERWQGLEVRRVRSLSDIPVPRLSKPDRLRERIADRRGALRARKPPLRLCQAVSR